MSREGRSWPHDADGDVFRRMQENGFNFDEPCLIDFNVDFNTWPPSAEAIRALESEYPSTKVYEPTSDEDGYVQFQVFAMLSYELIAKIQKCVTDLLAAYGGVCESWGVLYNQRSLPDGELREIYCDLNAQMIENGFSLERRGSIADLAKLGLTLESAIGMHFRFVSDDGDSEGNPDDIMFDGVVVRDAQYGILAVADSRGVFHRSDLVRGLLPGK